MLTRLATDDVVTTLPCVCTALRKLSTDATLLSAVLSSLPGGPPIAPIEPARMRRAYPRGAFLAEGGFKRVYKVIASSFCLRLLTAGGGC